MPNEQLLLGKLLLNNELIPKLSKKKVEFSEYNQKIFEAMEYLYSEKAPIDLLTLAGILKGRDQFDEGKGLSYLFSLIGEVEEEDLGLGVTTGELRT